MSSVKEELGVDLKNHRFVKDNCLSCQFCTFLGSILLEIQSCRSL